MTNFLKYLSFPVLALISSCAGNNLVTDKEYLKVIEDSFNERKTFAINRKKDLFTVFNDELSSDQSCALKFLYAFMPLSDLADYNGEFFLQNVNMALRAKSESSWGNDIPKDIFLHYVLPGRVNNENLDSFRIVYFNEINKRVKGMDIESAALEINHWCQEKVTYQPSDIRTSAPVSTILSARGRCGEESTLAVAALRTAGIPARQVYTPRWAHTDDNHAWVEVWINGKWFYMGACEPEPVLDRGWFTEYARRAMLVHTKSFGASSGGENVIRIHRNFTEVNNLSKYAPTKKIYVKVLNPAGEPDKKCTVEYQLYNYAEFYPLATLPVNQEGVSSFETGLGDLLVWAYDGDDFAFKKISVGETDTLNLKLNHQTNAEYNIDLDLNIPELQQPFPGPSADLVEKNAERIKEGITIRQEYIDSWIKHGEVVALALKSGLDTIKTAEVFSRCMGNYLEIKTFLLSSPDSLRNRALSLLEILPDKDLRDVKAATLSDHLLNSIKPKNIDNSMFLDYILNPRVANEMIVGWRSYFREKLPAQLREQALQDPMSIMKYLDENIKIAEEENYYKTPITPRGVYELKISDSWSRSICFVAICRSLGIPARFESVRNIPQYYLNKWNDVYFPDQKSPGTAKSYLMLKSSDTNPVPEYYTNFTLARFENGRYNTLDYNYSTRITEFRNELELPAGSYMCVTGNRLNSGKILSNISFFELSENEHKILDVRLRNDASENNFSGTVDIKKITGLFPETPDIIKNAGQHGIVILWIDPDQEPTKHIFNDLPLLKPDFDKWGGYFVFLSGSDNDEKTFKPGKLKGLPENSVFRRDNKMEMYKGSVKINPVPDVRLPIILVAGKDGSILFTSIGYSIGIGNQIIKYLK